MSGIKYTHQAVVKGYEEPVSVIKHDVCCAMCEKVLLQTVQIKEIPQEDSYCFICPSCGGKSFITTFYYKAFFEPMNCSISSIEKKGDVWVVNLLEN